MTNPSIPDPTPDPNETASHDDQPLDAYLETLQDVQQQQIELKVEVERIHREVERFRAFFQTLVSGLVLVILVSFGSAIWFAYRSFLQQQIARQTAEEMTVMQDEMQEQVTQLQGQLQRLQRDLPDQLNDVSEDVQSRSVEMEELRDRIQNLESQLETLNAIESDVEAQDDAATE